jgi:hypothetical protein
LRASENLRKIEVSRRALFPVLLGGTLAASVLAAEDDPFRLRSSFKGTLLLSHAPDAPELFPERESATSFWRMRFEPEARLHERVTLGAAYEQRIRVFSTESGAAGLPILPPDTPAPYRVRQLDWEITSTSGLSWRHEIDRAYAAVHADRVELTLGRQAVGWGRGVLFGAVDLFSPFTPLEVDREWRRGVDAIRADIELTTRSSLDVVGAFGESLDESAFAGRFRGYRGRLDLELVAGYRARDLFAGATSSAAVGGAELHFELALFRAPEALPAGGLGSEERVALKGVLGGSYRIPVANGILLFVEYHYSGFGAPTAEEILPLLSNPAFLARYVRGDTQILERHALAALVTYEVSPELTLNGQWIQSPVDGSGVLVPSGTWTLSDRLSLLGSMYLPWGAAPEGRILQSTYGAAAISGLVQIRIHM